MTKPRTDWESLWREERAQVQRLTEALIALKGTPGIHATTSAASSPPLARPLPKPIQANLGKLVAQIRAARPDATDEDALEEARRIAATFVADT